MLSILICDDDTRMIAAMKASTERILKESNVKAKIHTFMDAASMSTSIMSECDIALLDIDFDKAEYNGMDIARKLRSLHSDTIIIFITNFIEYAPAGYEVRAFRYILKRDLEYHPSACLATKKSRVAPNPDKWRNHQDSLGRYTVSGSTTTQCYSGDTKVDTGTQAERIQLLRRAV